MAKDKRQRTWTIQQYPDCKNDEFDEIRSNYGRERRSSPLKNMFIGLGFQKCATTWLALRLRRNPNVWYPPITELHFWDRYERGDLAMLEQRRHLTAMIRKIAAKPSGPGLLRLIDDLAYWKSYVSTIPDGAASYRKLFRPGTNEQAYGEIDPSYVGLRRETIALLSAMEEQPRVFVIMREPIARIWSQIRHEERLRPKAVAGQRKMLAYLESDRMRNQARYDALIDMLLECFPRDRVGFFFFEDMVENPEGYLRKVCDFIGAEYDPRMLRERKPERDGTEKRSRLKSNVMPDAVRARAVDLYGNQRDEVVARIGRIPEAWG